MTAPRSGPDLFRRRAVVSSVTNGTDASPDDASDGPETGTGDRREVDIEDQGQLVESTEDVDPDLEAVEADTGDPGPESAGARQATRSGDEPTVDEDGVPGSDG